MLADSCIYGMHDSWLTQHVHYIIECVTISRYCCICEMKYNS